MRYVNTVIRRAAVVAVLVACAGCGSGATAVDGCGDVPVTFAYSPSFVRAAVGDSLQIRTQWICSAPARGEGTALAWTLSPAGVVTTRQVGDSLLVVRADRAGEAVLQVTRRTTGERASIPVTVVDR